MKKSSASTNSSSKNASKTSNVTDKPKPKRKAPEFMAVQTQVTKKIREAENISHKEALKKLKSYFETANGQPYEKNGSITWLDGLKVTNSYLDSHVSNK